MNVETEVDSGGNFVDVLAPRPLGSDSVDFDLGQGDGDGFGNMDHDMRQRPFLYQEKNRPQIAFGGLLSGTSAIFNANMTRSGFGLRSKNDPGGGGSQIKYGFYHEKTVLKGRLHHLYRDGFMANFRRIKKQIKNGSIYFFLRLFFTVLGLLQRRMAFRVLEALGLTAYWLARNLRKKTFEQLKMIFGSQLTEGHLQKMTREVFLNLARNMVDAIRLQKYGPRTMDRLVRAEGLEKIDGALKKGSGLLLLTGHLGNWELFAAYMAFKGYPLHVVAAPIYDSRLDKLLVENRQHFGARVIPRGASATRKILQALKKNEIIGILIDQDSKAYEGVFVDFMGEEAIMPAGPVFLAMKTNTPVIPCAIHIEKDYRHVVDIGDEIPLEITGDSKRDLETNAQRCSKAVERLILRHPTQWIWVHDRWKTKRNADETG